MSKVPKYIAIKYMCEILYKRSKVQIPIYIGDIGDAWLHAAWSLQNTRRWPSVHLIDLIKF